MGFISFLENNYEGEHFTSIARNLTLTCSISFKRDVLKIQKDVNPKLQELFQKHNYYLVFLYQNCI